MLYPPWSGRCEGRVERGRVYIRHQTGEVEEGEWAMPYSDCKQLPVFFFFQAEDGIREVAVTGVQTCALPISSARVAATAAKVRGPRPGPPRSGGSINASSPDWPSESTASVENRPALSLGPAAGANTRLAISLALKVASSWVIVSPLSGNLLGRFR